MKIIKYIGFLLLTGFGMSSYAQKTMNLPIIQTKYTSDPAPVVHNDTIFSE